MAVRACQPHGRSLKAAAHGAKPNGAAISGLGFAPLGLPQRAVLFAFAVWLAT